MAYDPVLDREMFRAKSKGVEELRNTEESESVRARREQALAMIEAAKQKFDPANYQTLTEQDRPGVFRPVAVNIPAQQQTADTAMRMQQMAAQGVRPVGMADGGSVDNYMDGPENIYPTISSDPTSVGRIQALGSRIRSVGSMSAPASNLGVSAPDEALPVDQGEISGATAKSMQSPSTWSDEDIERLADYIFNAEKQKFETSTAKTPAGRGLQSLNVFRRAPDREKIKKDLEDQRTMSKQAGVTGAADEEERRRKAMIENPVPSVFTEVTPEKYAEAQARREAALKSASEAGGITDLGVPAPELPAAPSGFETKAGGIDNLGVPVAEPAAAPSGLEALRAPGTVQGGRVPGARDDFEETVTPTPKAAKPAGITAVGAAQDAGAAPKLPDMSQAGPTDMQQIKAERARAREENINLALIRAGLGIMAGKSSNALANIGEGAQAGIGAFTEGEKTAQQQMREAVSDLREQQKMAQDKAYRESMLGFEKTKMGMESERLGLARDAAAQNKAEFNQTLEFKKQESQNALKSAEATRDATAIREASRQVSELRNTIITRIQMLQSSNQATIDPVGTKAQIEALTKQLEAAEEDANAIRKIQGLSLPSQNKPSATMSSDPLGLRGK